MSKKWDLPTAWALIWAQTSLHCYQRLATPIATLGIGSGIETIKDSGAEMKMRDKKYEHGVLIVPNGTVELGDKEFFGHLKMVTNTNF